MKVNRSELFKSISYAGGALVIAGYLRSTIEGTLSSLDIGLMIGGGALLVIAIAFNLGGIGRFFGRRSSKLGINTIVLSISVLAILCGINILVFRHNTRIDMSSGHLYSLSPQSRKIASHLDRNIRFLYFDNQANPVLSQRMAEYRTYNRRIQYRRIDPIAHPGVAKQYNIRTMGDIIATNGTRTIHLHGTAEEDITNALVRLSRTTVKTVCFVEGHGEKSVNSTGGNGYSDVKNELTKESYKVQSVNLVSSGGVPGACNVLVIAGPKKAFFPQETTMVEKYLDNGGKVFVLADPGTHTGLQPLFNAWNIKVGDNIVIDASGVGRLYGTGPAVPLVHDYGNSPITQGFGNSMTFFPLARTVNVAEKSKTTPTEVELLKTSPASFTTPKITGKTVSFNPKTDMKGPLTLGVTAQKTVGKKEARLAVFGNSTFATNSWVGEAFNGDLFYNTVSWLSRNRNLISIRPKSATNRRVTMTQAEQRTLMWLSLGILPGLFVLGGILIWFKRR